MDSGEQLGRNVFNQISLRNGSMRNISGTRKLPQSAPRESGFAVSVGNLCQAWNIERWTQICTAQEMP